MQSRPGLTPELESACEDVWAHFTSLGGKAPASFDLIVAELRTLCEMRAFAVAFQRGQGEVGSRSARSRSPAARG